MKPWRRSSVIVIAAAITFIVVGGVLLLWVPGMLLQHWIPKGSAEERNRALGSAAQVVLLGLGGVIASVGVTLSILRHREELEESERDRARLEHDKEKEITRRREAELQRILDIDRELRSRFVIAVDLLSATETIKRSAALYSLGALADDWAARGRPDEVQVCISVICSYLRAPLPNGIRKTPPGEIEVKTVGYRLIRRHLDVPAPHSRGEDGVPGTSWGGSIVDLSGAYIDFGVDIMRAELFGGGILYLMGATIRGDGHLELEATLDDNSRVFGVGMNVGEGTTVIIQAILHDIAEVDVSVTTVDGGLFGLMVGLGKSNQVKCGFLNVMNGGSAQLKLHAFSENGELNMLDALLNEGGIELSGALIDENGPVTLPDDRRYSISPA